jgi:hypothetical protein
MTVTVNDLVLTVRRQAGDWGAALMCLDTAMTDVSSNTTLSVESRPDVLREGQYVEVELETMEITDISTDITVRRASKGTTITGHFIGDLAIVEPRFPNLTILRALIKAERVLAGYIPKKTVTTGGTYVTSSSVEDFALPTGAEYLDSVQLEKATSGLYGPFYGYTILDGADPPSIHIPRGVCATGKNLRLVTLGQYTEFVWDASVSDIPLKYHDFLCEYAAGVLLEQEDTHVTAETEQAHGVAPKPGVNQQVGRNMQASAFAHLEAVKPMTRIIHRPDQRMYRR